ncbi:hypothetical protein CJD36_015665 [Flavipsychrobacter stenotrophus]|uniref:Cytochrome c domain-containing protein n=1 Tax=Flavipsychrobacter stenotrophus TaxID=2077091 RepID=A0A2S7ST87_9BACT|nr:cytochrome c [Flavipsychrobacter stenotrophus]PQJ10133.1 hypothetical protein CJD36_015665 [Flavipsychrobacter stenotrophus]
MRKGYIILVFCLVFAVLLSCKTHYQLANKAYARIEIPTSLERGKNLAYNICADCYYDKTVKKFIGMRYLALPRIAGKVYSANLTNSKTNGVITGYSDGELAYLLKTGITRDGRFIPYMLRPKMADDDINDLIIYLRSGDEAVQAGDTSVGHSHLNFIGRIAIRKIAKPQPYITSIKRPGKDDAIANGRYLVDNIGCFHCHSKSIAKLNYLDAEQSRGYLQGGMKFKDESGNKIHAANLTPDSSTGIGGFTRAQFQKAIMEGVAPGGRKLHPPMPHFTHLTDKQVSDIYAYLMSIPAVHKRGGMISDTY